MCPEISSFSLFSHLETFDKIAIKDMTERSMAQVMHQSSNCHISNLVICDLQVWLCISEDLHLLPGQICDTDTVFEAAMAWRSR